MALRTDPKEGATLLLLRLQILSLLILLDSSRLQVVNLSALYFSKISINVLVLMYENVC